jgi:hypothetical protein
VLVDDGFTPRQAGRMLQRLFEIEAYRMLALLALPIARRQSPRIVAIETALAGLTDGIARDDGQDETLLHELTRLAAEVESGLSRSQFRFGACRAYSELVATRIAELRELRMPGLQTIEEFMARRFTPAVATCTTVSQRLHDLSERVAQASALLATRVGIARERQNQALLASMDRRAKLQLRLQQTVEGLSVAAIVYYATGLVGYLAKGAKAAGAAAGQPDVLTAVALARLLLVLALPCAPVLAVLRASERSATAIRPRLPSSSSRTMTHGLPLFQRHRRPGRDEARHPDRRGRPQRRRRAGLRRPRHRQEHRGARAGRAAAADEGGGGLPLRLRPGAPRAAPATRPRCRPQQAGKTHRAGAGGRPAAGRHRRPRRRRARHRAALTQGVKAFEPGLLARANRGFLYIDEVNLLEDHLVDLLIDVAASGENVVEREGLSVRHPARFVLVGSGNPEEGELRPQLLDRFGLAVEVRTPRPTWPAAHRGRQAPRRLRARPRGLRRALEEGGGSHPRAPHREAARERLPEVAVGDAALERIAGLCMALGTDGLRGELTLMRAARALAALDGDRGRGRRAHAAAWPARRCATACAATRWTTPMPACASSAPLAEQFGA